MKRALLLFLLGFFLQAGYAQENLGLNELLELLNVNPNKLDNHLQKKGYKKNYIFSDGESGAAFVKTTMHDSSLYTQFFKYYRNNTGLTLRYETSIQTEFKNLKDEIVHAGFSCAPISINNKKDCMLFQKKNISIESEEQVKIEINDDVKDTLKMYTLSVTKIDLPKLKDIHYAEDLLSFTSNECLDAVFGKENVKKDVFYYSEKDTNRCSVIYPNTNSEAIFVWNDEANYRDIAFIIFGGNLKSTESTENVNQIRHNIWFSKQGIHCGMSLSDVQSLNKESISFYNWKTESAGFVVPKNKGALNFEKLGMTFNCLNCSYIENKKTNIIQSDEAIEENQKVFVSSMVVLPEKKSKEKFITSLR